MSNCCNSCGRYFETSSRQPRQCKICNSYFCEYSCCSSYDNQYDRYDICAPCGYKYKGKHNGNKTSDTNDECIIC